MPAGPAARSARRTRTSCPDALPPRTLRGCRNVGALADCRDRVRGAVVACRGGRGELDGLAGAKPERVRAADRDAVSGVVRRTVDVRRGGVLLDSNSNPAGTLAELWNGSSWSLLMTPKLAAGTLDGSRARPSRRASPWGTSARPRRS